MPLERSSSYGSGQSPAAGGRQVTNDIQAVLHNIQGLRILAVAEIRGRLSSLNELAKQHNASVIIHSGNFGFFDLESIGRIIPRTLRHISMFSPLLDASKLPQDSQELKNKLAKDALSELPHFISGKMKLNVPVYCIYGASEDLSVIEKFNNGTYSVPNLFIVDETKTYGIETGGGHVIRLMGLGGSLVLHRFFDNGDGNSTIAGTHGLMWTTALQIGQLVQTVKKSFDASEIRIFISHPCPSREGLLLALAIALRADFTMSSGLHFIYGSSYNAFTAESSFDSFKGKLVAARAQFMDIWDNVKVQVTNLLEKDTKQRLLLQSALDIFERMPVEVGNENSGNDYLLAAYRNMWNFNLCDAEYGSLVLNIVDGRVGVESKSQGFDFKYRKPSKQITKPLTAAAVAAAGAARAASTKDKSIPIGPGQTNINGVPSAPKTAPTTAPTTTTPTAPTSSTPPTSTQTPTPSSTPTPPTNGSTSIPPEEPQPQLPGIWVSNGQASEEEIKSFFPESDRELITTIEIKESYNQPDKKFALVHFSTPEQAKSAIDRIDKEKAGRVSIIGDRYGNLPRRGGHFFRGGSRGGRGNLNNRGRPRPSTK